MTLRGLVAATRKVKIGKHWVSDKRAYSTLRLLGLVTIGWSLLFAVAIIGTRGLIIGTPGWAPMTDFTGGYIVTGAGIGLAGILGLIGLACDDDDVHRWPRIVSVVSACVGFAWCFVVLVSFINALFANWPNAGPLMIIPGAVLHWSRLVLLWEFPDRDA